ncbi:glycosyltransferase [Ruegeria faecimaris]|uniref:glycosyltransferase n=2 Tax=Ruegeria faecimaris TaxID=686389 RepID=UPI0024926158|nr:glycosyltransferase [Ruegeria faecimaris]
MIMHVITDFSGQGGAQAMLARLVAISGDRVLVVSLTEVSDRIKSQCANPNAVLIGLNARSLSSMPRAILQISRLIRQYKPQAVLCWMYHAMVIGLIASWISDRKVPIYWTVRQALDDTSSFTRSTRIAVDLCRRLSGRCAGIIYNSQRALDQHTKNGFAAARSCVIPNGLIMPQASVVRSDPPRVFGIAARFHPQKDHETLFQALSLALRSVPDLRIIAAGENMSPENSEVQSLLARYNLTADNVELCGDLHDMAAFYKRIDALVLSSRTEGFPNVIVEAMSYGHPVVSTDVGDAVVIIRNCGLIVPPRNAELLADALVHAANWSAPEYLEKREKARAIVASTYQLYRVAAQYRNILESGSLDPDKIASQPEQKGI